MEAVHRVADSLPVQLLTHRDVHAWHASLVQPVEVVYELGSFLSNEETTRAERFYFEQHRQSFVVGRGILRSLLSHYTGVAPQQLQFGYTQTGKPFLVGRDDSRDLCFNLSHSGEFALYAFSRGRQVGIDVEHIRPIDDIDHIAETNFSNEEYKKFRTVSEHARLRTFFNCWTRKEAFTKAVGDGISFPLQNFDVSLEVGCPARLLSVRGSAQNANKWSMHDLETLEGYVAALVVEGKGYSISLKQWTYAESKNTDGSIA